MGSEYMKTIAKGNNDMSMKLYEEVVKQVKGNVIYSPISVHTILSLLHQGSTGKIANDMQRVLGIPEKSFSAAGFQELMTSLNGVQNITLEMANKVFVMEGCKLNPTFKEVALKSFNAGADEVNFAENQKAASTINGWVEEKTKDKIKNLIDPNALNSLTRMVLVNAIYFKGDWAKKFNKNNTTKQKFYTSTTDSVEVDMMHMKDKFFYGEKADLDAKVLSIPYLNQDVSLVVVLPNDVDGIEELEKKLINYDMSNLTKDNYKMEVELSLPKFKIETTIDLNQPLKNIGLDKMFAVSEDLSGLLSNPNEPLYVSKVIQKAFIEVNEEGAEAAAATAMMMMCFSAPMPQPTMEFNADHPFFYGLHHKATEQFLFMGKVSNF
ncbi:PREDICTED: serine protease inhibitor 3/4-like isoform X3 [Nicrophorus vespilloides]|uniref:Serine protease inhibitor 3/4-like isoform X3 n=1 Tax=Nicrophorus vespilloides TaxID=110193 RepID=A0ABM1M328_NICVS|nr:PREDICTED: serine protease inhibitor 3/4-like isoform X3 [Nicrophorus vespilloides]